MTCCCTGGFGASIQGQGNQNWTVQTVEFSAGFGTAPVQAWAASGIVAVRSVVIFEDSNDPIVAAGGALTVRVGFNRTATVGISDIFSAPTIATLNLGRVRGWGVGGAIAPAALLSNPNGEGGVILASVGAFNGTDPTSNERDGIYLATDVGSVTGTLFLVFEFRTLL